MGFYMHGLKKKKKKPLINSLVAHPTLWTDIRVMQKLEVGKFY